MKNDVFRFDHISGSVNTYNFLKETYGTFIDGSEISVVKQIALLSDS